MFLGIFDQIFFSVLQIVLDCQSLKPKFKFKETKVIEQLSPDMYM